MHSKGSNSYNGSIKYMMRSDREGFSNFKRNQIYSQIREKQEIIGLDVELKGGKDVEMVAQKYHDLKVLNVQGFIQADLVQKLLSTYPKLQQFLCYYRGDHSIFAKALGLLKHLQTLSIHKSNLGDRELGCFPQIPGLIHLDLEYNKISSAGVQHLSKFPNLQSLQLNNNQIDSEGVIKICLLFPNLKRLSLWGCPVKDRGAIEISKLKKLEFLNLGVTQITELGCLKLVHNLQDIQDLKLWSIPITKKCADISKYIAKLNRAERCIIQPR